MWEMMLLEVLVKAAILCGILYLIARHEADFSFSKVSMVVAAIMLGSLLMKVFLEDQLGPFYVVPVLLLAVYMIKSFCWISWGKSAIVIAIFSIFHIGIALGMGLVMARVFTPSNTMVDQANQRMERAQREILESMVEDAPRGRAFAPPAVREEIAAMMEGAEAPVEPRPQARPQPPAQPEPLAEPEPVAAATKPPSRPATVVRTEPPGTPVVEARTKPPEPAPIQAAPAAAAPPPAEAQPPAELAPPAEATPPAELPPEWQEARRALKIDGIMKSRSGNYNVLIGGKVRQKGETVTQSFKGKTFKWRILAINTGGPVLEPVGL